jgi:hypothetical protein
MGRRVRTRRIVTSVTWIDEVREREKKCICMSNEGLISVVFDITSMENASIHKYVYMCIDVVILRVHIY